MQEAYLEFQKKAPRKLPHLEAEKSDPYQRWLRHNRLAPALLAAMEKSADSLRDAGPKIAVVADLRGTTEDQLQRTGRVVVGADLFPLGIIPRGITEGRRSA